MVARGVGTCPAVSRVLTWMPARTQSGLIKTGECLDLLACAFVWPNVRGIVHLENAQTQMWANLPVCFDSATLTTQKATRCFTFHVRSTNYNLGIGSTL